MPRQPKPPESPGPTRPPTSPPATTGSGPSARRGSASPFVADAGPAFDAREADELAAAVPEPPALAVLPGGGGVAQVEEETVRGVLVAKGEVLHLLDASGAPEVWRYTEADLRAIAPPLTRILNRYPAAAEAAAELGDPVAAGIGFFNYGLRNLQARRLAARAAEQEEELPVSGVSAPPGTGPTAPPAQGPEGAAGGGPAPGGDVEWTT